ncbi:MAG: hypothetical protein WB689_07630 [Xanthobacteraceae bacterium]
MRRCKLIAFIAPVAVAALPLIAPGTAVARGGHNPIKNSIQCSAFKKMADGTWYVGRPTTFRIGPFKKTTFREASIGPDNFMFGEADLYEALEAKCGAHLKANRAM